MQPLPDLPSIMGAIPWVLVGGIALRAYAPERMTLDIDIMIAETDEARTRTALQQAGYTVIGHLTIGGFSVARADEPVIDVLSGRQRWLRAALTQPTYDAAGYPVMPRPYLTLMKLQAGRAQDVADVQRLLRDTPPTERATTRQLVAQEAPDLVEDYDSLIILTDLEFGAPTPE